jgi:hypothetical protein
MGKTADDAFEQEGPPPCMIYVDKEGTWFHNGAPIIRRDMVLLFYQSLHLDEEGRYVIKFKDQLCRLDVEDTPFVVVRTEFVPADNDGEKDRFILYLIDDTKEELAPDTLWVGSGNVIYCKIRGGNIKARFSRAAYYQLAEYIQEARETGKYFLPLNHEKHCLEEDLSK